MTVGSCRQTVCACVHACEGGVSPSETEGDAAPGLSSQSLCKETPRKPGSCRQGASEQQARPSNLQSHSARLAASPRSRISTEKKDACHPRQRRGLWLPHCPPLWIRRPDTFGSFSSSEGPHTAPAGSHAQLMPSCQSHGSAPQSDLLGRS